MPCNVLSKSYIEHASMGQCALQELTIGPAQIATGLMCAGFLYAQMEDTSSLPISTRVAITTLLPPSPHMSARVIHVHLPGTAAWLLSRASATSTSLLLNGLSLPSVLLACTQTPVM